MFIARGRVHQERELLAEISIRKIVTRAHVANPVMCVGYLGEKAIVKAAVLESGGRFNSTASWRSAARHKTYGAILRAGNEMAIREVGKL